MAEDDRLQEAYAAGRTAPRNDHPPDEEWERLALGEMNAFERAALIDHVVRCASCGDVYRGVKELEEGARAFDPGVPRPKPVAAPWRPAWYGGLAAAAVLLVALMLPSWRGDAPPPDTVRSAPVITPAPVAPVGVVSSVPRELRWEAVPGADGYRVDLSNGGPLWSSGRVVETHVALPTDVKLSPGILYYWKVTALAGPDRRLLDDVSSALVSFEIAR
jgi:hypothetical protein